MKRSFSVLCLLTLALAGSSIACGAGNTEGDETSEGKLAAPTGVPGDPLIMPVLVSEGEFELSAANQPSLPASDLVRLSLAGGVSGKATINTYCLACGTGGAQPEGEPGVPFFDSPPRVYNIFAEQVACGKIYTGHIYPGTEVPTTSGASIKIYDYRQPTASCAADIAAIVTVDETVNGVTRQFYGKVVDAKPPAACADGMQLCRESCGAPPLEGEGPCFLTFCAPAGRPCPLPP